MRRLPRLSLRQGRIPESKAWAALLVAWSGLWLAVVAYLDPALTRVLAVALFAAVATLGLWRLLPFAGLMLAALALATYAAVSVLTIRAESGPLSAVLPPILAFTLGILGVGALAEALARRTERDELQRQTDTRMIEELTPTVADTAAMKWEHARRALREELARGRRYGHKVTLTLVGVDDWEEYVEQRGAEAARETQTRLASVLESTVRPTDKVAYRQAGEIAVIFPHTDVRGAQRAVERIRQIIRNALELEVRAGVAEFPEDAVDVDGLVREADFALAFARQSGLFVASRSLLDRA